MYKDNEKALIRGDEINTVDNFRILFTKED